jgi:hypothetical protein
MNIAVKFILCITFLLASLFSTAQNISKTELQIRKLEQQIVKAILNADTNALKQLWAPEFLVNNPRSSVTSSLDSVIALQKNSLLNYSVFKRNIEAIQFQKGFVITMGK